MSSREKMSRKIKVLSLTEDSPNRFSYMNYFYENEKQMHDGPKYIDVLDKSTIGDVEERGKLIKKLYEEDEEFTGEVISVDFEGWDWKSTKWEFTLNINEK